MYLLDCVFWVIWKNQYDFPIPELCHNPFFLPTLPQRGGEKKTSQWFSKRGSDSVKTLADVAVIWTTSAFRNKVKSHSSNWWTQLLALHATYTLTSHLADKTACSCLNLIPGWYVLLPLYSRGQWGPGTAAQRAVGAPSLEMHKAPGDAQGHGWALGWWGATRGWN